MHILNPHLRRLPRHEILIHQPMPLLATAKRILGHRRILRRTSRFLRDPGFQIQYKSEGRVAIQIVAVQAFSAEEAEVFVDAEGGGVVYFGFESDLNMPSENE